MGGGTTSKSSQPTTMRSRQSGSDAGGVASISESLDQVEGFMDSLSSGDPSNIDQDLQQRADQAKITDKQGKQLQERKEHIREILEEDLAVEEVVTYGSAVKGTMTGPMDKDSDIDFMIVLNSEEHGNWANDKNGPKNALGAFKRRLQSRLQIDDDKISIRGNVVQIRYNNMTVEVAPAFYYSSVRNPENPVGTETQMGLPYYTPDNPQQGYVIPDTSGKPSWIGTNPRKDKRMLDAVDQSHQGKVKRMAREVRDYHERHKTGIRSYHAEIMVRRYFREEATGTESYREAMRGFLRKHPEYIRGETREPVYGERVDDGLDQKTREKAARKAERSKKLAEESENLEREGRIEESKKRMSEALDEV